MPTIASNQPMPKKLLRTALEASVAASIFGGILLTLTACGGGYPMTVEQRYTEPKTPNEILQDKIDAARRTERAHGAF